MSSFTRRRLLASVATGGSASLAGCSTALGGGKSASTLPNSQSWTQYGYDAANTAYNPQAKGPSEEPTVDWELTGGSYYGNTMQILVEGQLFVNGYDGVYKLDPKTGEELWHDKAISDTLTPTLADDLVLPGGFGLRSVSKSGGIDVFGRRFDYQRWQTNLTYPLSPVTFANGALFAGLDTLRGQIVAVDASDGSVDWTRSVGSMVTGAPAVVDGVVYVARRRANDRSKNFALFALDAKTGDEDWKHDFGPFKNFYSDQGPVVGDGLVYQSAGAGLLAFDTKSGAQVWSFEPPQSVGSAPALAQGTLYLATLDAEANDSNGRLYALDAGTGETQWKMDVPKWYGSPSVAGDGVYGIDYSGTLHSWTHDGRKRWQVELNRRALGTPVVAGGRVYVGAEKRLFCLS